MRFFFLSVYNTGLTKLYEYNFNIVSTTCMYIVLKYLYSK